MALYNLAGFKTTTLGTADVVFSAPVTALNTFPLAGVPNGSTVTYMLENFDGAGSVDAREVGRGVWNSGTLTLARTTVVDSTNGGAKIVLGGTAEARITAIAQDFSASAVGAPALVSPSVVGNFTSFSNVSGGQADSGFSGTSFQPIDATLTSIAALGSAADKMIYTTALDTWAEADLSAFARTFLDDANAAAVRTTIGAGTGSGDISGTGVVGQVAEFVTNTKTIQAANLIAPTGAILTLVNASAKSITFPGSTNDTVAMLATANVFTAAQMVDLSADAIGLTIQGHSTQTNDLLLLETSTGTDLLTVDGLGNIAQAATSTDHTVGSHNQWAFTLTAGTNLTPGTVYAYDSLGTIISNASITGTKTFVGTRFLVSWDDPSTNANSGAIIGGRFHYQNNVGSSLSLGTGIGGEFQVTSASSRTGWIATAAIAGRFNISLQSSSAHTTAAAYSLLLTTHVKNANITITNAYGLYVEAMTVGATNYAIFTNAGLVHFGDSIDLASGKSITLIAGNIAADTTTGTKIGTATSQKLGFWNVTPIIQPASANQAALTNSTGGTYNGTLIDVGALFSQTNINDNFTDVHTLLNEIRTALVNSGIMKGAA